MKDTKFSYTVKAFAFSLLGILLLSGIYLAANRYIFASATDREIHLAPTNPEVPPLTRLDVFPEGYPHPEFIIHEMEGSQVLLTPNALSATEAAHEGSKYVWEMFGTDITGKTVSMYVDNFPSSTRTHWNGVVFSVHPIYDMVIHYRFSIDTVTGERIAIAVADWFPIEEHGETVSGGSHERLIEIFTEIAADYAQRHFNFSTVESVSYEGMRSLADYQTILECDEGVEHTVIQGNFPCHAIMNGETLMDFTAVDNTGRSARLAISMERMSLNALTTGHNDIMPGLDAARATPEPPAPHTYWSSVPINPGDAPGLSLYLGRSSILAVQLQPSVDFHMFYMAPIPTLELTHTQNLPLDWQYISMDFEDANAPVSVNVTRRRADQVGHNYSLDFIDIPMPSGLQPSAFGFRIPVLDDGYDYFYFVRIVWEDGFIHNAFRVNSGVHPEIGEDVPEEPDQDYASGPVWVVQPTIYHNRIRQCNCGQFVSADWQTIDPVTGQVSGEHLGHGGHGPALVYDQARNLFGHPGYGFGYHDMLGMHQINDFLNMLNNNYAEFYWWRNPTDGLIAIESVDSAIRNYYDFEYVNEGNNLVRREFWYLPTEAHSGRFALMYNGVFETDFIFDGVNIRFAEWEQLRDSSTMSVSQNGRWGLVDRRGNTLIPFMFENLVIIDQNTAFARHNGRYGILSLPRTIENME
ncbi:MAG: WG repeat-containing protein [Defluviitaleaceae bacterium]|nr:WG repeat-containing protein [Defluviitaleaceae bacterium]